MDKVRLVYEHNLDPWVREKTNVVRQLIFLVLLLLLFYWIQMALGL